MTAIAVRARNLGKHYLIEPTARRSHTLKASLWQAAQSAFRRRGTAGGGLRDLWALRHVSFELEQGTVLGVIGRNGAGKSTLLKILARVTDPSAGEAEYFGRVGALLQVGTGFHHDLSGRDNILLSGAILGMRRAEILRRFDEIVAFSDVEAFLETPVRHYSSGMYMRLAFAVAAHLDSEVLLVDEVLAVGDAEFQRRCLGKMDEVARNGRTVIFVSHNLAAIQRLTHQTMVLEGGRAALLAPTGDAVAHYLDQHAAAGGERLWPDPAAGRAQAPFVPLAVRVRDGSGRVVGAVRAGEPFSVEVDYRLQSPVHGFRVGVRFQTTGGEDAFTSFDTDDRVVEPRDGAREPGRYRSRCTVPGGLLNEGRFLLGLLARGWRRGLFSDEHALAIKVEPGDAEGLWAEPRPGPFRPLLAWQVEPVAGGEPP
jgi:lipopolysaccharide transport system ATP-binding protein